MYSSKSILSAFILCVASICYMEASPVPENGFREASLLGRVDPELHPASPEMDVLIQGQLEQIKEHLQRDVKRIEPVAYLTQIVQGTNYFVKCKVTEQSGETAVVHIKVYKPIRSPATLVSVSEGHSLESPIEYFE